MRIESVTTQLARLPLPGGAWQDAIQDVTHIEIIVTDVTSDTGSPAPASATPAAWAG